VDLSPQRGRESVGLIVYSPTALTQDTYVIFNVFKSAITIGNQFMTKLTYQSSSVLL